MPRLVSISFTVSPRLPGMHGSPLSFDVPVRSGPLTAWKISVRPESILLRSPPGWQPGDNARRAMSGPATEVTVYEIPRATAALVWSWDATETIGEVVQWDEDADAYAEAVRKVQEAVGELPDAPTGMPPVRIKHRPTAKKAQEPAE